MLGTLLKKEMLGHVLSLRFAVTFLLILLLVFSSFYLSARAYQQRVDEYGAMSRSYRQALDDVLDEEDAWDRMWRLYEWEGKSDAVPVVPLSSIAEGLTRAHPVGITTTAEHWTNMDTSLLENPLLGMYQMPDLVYVVGVVLSLLALLIVFDAVCGEKESGMLRLTLSNAVPRHNVLLSKWLGGYLVLIVPFLVASLGGLGYMWASGTLEWSGSVGLRIGLILLLGLLYVSVFFTLGMFISCLTRRSATALFICLFVWVGWVLAVPNVAPVAAKFISPAPSPRKIAAEKDAIDREIRLKQRRLTLISGEVWYGQKIERQREKLNQEGRTRKRRWDRYLQERTDSQTQWAQLLGRLSPSACWVYAATSMAQTGPDAYKQFEAARKRLRDQMREDFDRDRKIGRSQDEPPEIRAEAVPALAVTYPTLDGTLTTVLPDLLILVVLNVLFFLAAFAAFLRYDVR